MKGRPYPDPAPQWIAGPPPGRGRYWVVWKMLSGSTRVDVIELSPALIHGDNPDAPLMVKTLTGLAYRFDEYRERFTHHIELDAPSLPRARS